MKFICNTLNCLGLIVPSLSMLSIGFIQCNFILRKSCSQNDVQLKNYNSSTNSSCFYRHSHRDECLGGGGGHALGQSVRETGETGGRGRRWGWRHGNAVTTPTSVSIRGTKNVRIIKFPQVYIIHCKLWEVVRYQLISLLEERYNICLYFSFQVLF